MRSKGDSYLLTENKRLISENELLNNKLDEAKEVIRAIQDGSIDEVYDVNTGLISGTADHTYRNFIENMPEGVVTLNTEGLIIFSNSSFAKMINLPLEKMAGKKFRDFIPAEYAGNFDNFFNDHSEVHSRLELSVLDITGNRKHFQISLNKLQLRHFLALNLVWVDVTDQKIAEEKIRIINENLNKAIVELTGSQHTVLLLNSQLKENIKILEDANAKLATFAHIASHDLQEPLRKITTYSSLLLRDYKDSIDQQGRNYLTVMQNGSERMRNLINDILEYAELSQKGFSFAQTSLQDVMNEVFSNLELRINENEAKITIEQELPVIEANPGQMRQLFQNILSNSLKFVSAGTTPEINISYKIVDAKDLEPAVENTLNGEFYIFCIRDNGIGFSQEYNDKIFTIFQRLNGNASYQGTGIGLAICKKIVEQHNGRITAEGILNEGSVFTITLPVSQTPKQENGQQAAIAAVSNQV